MKRCGLKWAWRCISFRVKALRFSYMPQTTRNAVNTNVARLRLLMCPCTPQPHPLLPFCKQKCMHHMIMVAHPPHHTIPLLLYRRPTRPPLRSPTRS